jgi:hypothetical protein
MEGYGKKRIRYKTDTKIRYFLGNWRVENQDKEAEVSKRKGLTSRRSESRRRAGLPRLPADGEGSRIRARVGPGRRDAGANCHGRPEAGEVAFKPGHGCVVSANVKLLRSAGLTNQDEPIC